MKISLELRYDQADGKRLEAALRGVVFAEILAQVMRNLYWWYQETDNEEAQAYERTFKLVLSELAAHGLYLEYEPDGKVITRDGKVTEKKMSDHLVEREATPVQEQATADPASKAQPPSV